MSEAADKIDMFKAKIRANKAAGMSEQQAIYRAIVTDLGGYVAMLRSCKLTDDEIVRCVETYAIPDDERTKS